MSKKVEIQCTIVRRMKDSLLSMHHSVYCFARTDVPGRKMVPRKIIFPIQRPDIDFTFVRNVDYSYL